jgi:integrase
LLESRAEALLELLLEQMPLVRYPFCLDQLPENGLYFFYEQGETWGHGGTRPRIVRVGTHRDGNFRRRIAEHYLLNEAKMNFNKDKPKPSDRSIFRKNIGKTLLKNEDPYLKIWEIDFMTRNNKMKFSNKRDITKEQETEEQITKVLRDNFAFRFITPQNMRNNFEKQRHRLIRTLQNPKLREIHLHTLRHWKATMEYHRTKNIKFVQNILGHKKLENTDVYTQLMNFESDEWRVAHAGNLEEENKLIEAGFEYVSYSEKDEVAIYRKPK